MLYPSELQARVVLGTRLGPGPPEPLGLGRRLVCLVRPRDYRTGTAQASRARGGGKAGGAPSSAWTTCSDSWREAFARPQRWRMNENVKPLRRSLGGCEPRDLARHGGAGNNPKPCHGRPASEHSVHHHGRRRHRPDAVVRLRRGNAAAHPDHRLGWRSRESSSATPGRCPPARRRARVVFNGRLPARTNINSAIGPNDLANSMMSALRADHTEAAGRARLPERAVRQVPHRAPGHERGRPAAPLLARLGLLRRLDGRDRRPELDRHLGGDRDAQARRREEGPLVLRLRRRCA